MRGKIKKEEGVGNMAQKEARKWELLSPEAVAEVVPMSVNPHPSTLAGKTVVLRTNGKHNSDNFLEKVVELLGEEVKDIKIIELWRVAPETNTSSQSPEESQKFAEKIASFKPDLVISAQGD
jgi:hypothetical protein